MKKYLPLFVASPLLLSATNALAFNKDAYCKALVSGNQQEATRLLMESGDIDAAFESGMLNCFDDIKKGKYESSPSGSGANFGSNRSSATTRPHTSSSRTDSSQQGRHSGGTPINPETGEPCGQVEQLQSSRNYDGSVNYRWKLKNTCGFRIEAYWAFSPGNPTSTCSINPGGSYPASCTSDRCSGNIYTAFGPAH